MYLLWISILPIIVTHAWITPTTIRIITSVPQQQNCRTICQQANTNDNDATTIKTIYQRTFYRLSPGSDVDIHNSIVLEDRMSIRTNINNINDMTTENDSTSSNTEQVQRTILLRDGNVDENEIGDSFYSITPETTMSTSEIVMALYLASNPTMCTEDMLEISSETGLATILGAIGAGFVSRREQSLSESSSTNNNNGDDNTDVLLDDILTISKGKDALLPKNLNQLTLTASDERHLDVLFRNSKHAGIVSPGKVLVQPLDWRIRTTNRRGTVPEMTTIVAVDLALTYPEAISLARTCAYRLKSSWIGRDITQPIPRLVHICPSDGRHEDVTYLQRELTHGYKMTVSTGYLKLEKIIFQPQQVSGSISDQQLEDMDLEVQKDMSLTFTSLLAQHHPDYAGGGSGELFFPADTGENTAGFRESGV